MTDQLIPQREWEAQERYMRFQSHADAIWAVTPRASSDPHDLKLINRACGWDLRAAEAKAAWDALVKEREGK